MDTLRVKEKKDKKKKGEGKSERKGEQRHATYN